MLLEVKNIYKSKVFAKYLYKFLQTKERNQGKMKELKGKLKRNKLTKQSKGITFIALVITIVLNC